MDAPNLDPVHGLWSDVMAFLVNQMIVAISLCVITLAMQPFDVATTVLQCKAIPLNERREFSEDKYDGRDKEPPESAESWGQPPASTKGSYQLTLERNSSIREVIWKVRKTYGIRSVWKGATTAFIYAFLFEILQSSMGAVFAAMLGVENPFAMKDSEANDLQISRVVILTVTAMISGVILAPIDLVLTK
jgi:hypothetical protein